ncbi:MAG: porin family protein [Bacteroidales bacterium]|nr:porin family protein [Bacteroidales bacterium]
MRLTNMRAVVVLTALCLSVSVMAQNPTSSRGTVQQTYKWQEPEKKPASTRPRIELTPIYGYSLNGHINLYRAKFKMDNSDHFGGILSLEVAPQSLVEFTYTRSKTTARYEDYLTGAKDNYDMAIDYFQLGTVKELNKGPLVPFGMASIGITWFNMITHGVSDHVSFSAALGGGIKYFFSDRIGIRLQGRLLLPMYFSGGGLFVGIGSGGTSSGVSVSTGVLTVQGDFSGGLIFRF